MSISFVRGKKVSYFLPQESEGVVIEPLKFSPSGFDFAECCRVMDEFVEKHYPEEWRTIQLLRQQ